MNRQEYLEQLKKYLKRLPKSDYEQAMDYFTEHFEDAGEEHEQDVIAELGSPKEAAAELLQNLLEQKTEGENGKAKKGFPWNSVLVAVLAVLAAPLGLPLLLCGAVLLLCGVILIACLMIMAAGSVIMGVFLGGKLLIRGILAIPFSIPGFCLISGTGILVMGISILIFLLTWKCGRWLAEIILKLIRKILKKGSRKA